MHFWAATNARVSRQRAHCCDQLLVNNTYFVLNSSTQTRLRTEKSPKLFIIMFVWASHTFNQLWLSSGVRFLCLSFDFPHSVRCCLRRTLVCSCITLPSLCHSFYDTLSVCNLMCFVVRFCGLNVTCFTFKFMHQLHSMLGAQQKLPDLRKVVLYSFLLLFSHHALLLLRLLFVYSYFVQTRNYL